MPGAVIRCHYATKGNMRNTAKHMLFACIYASWDKQNRKSKKIWNRDVNSISSGALDFFQEQYLKYLICGFCFSSAGSIPSWRIFGRAWVSSLGDNDRPLTEALQDVPTKRILGYFHSCLRIEFLCKKDITVDIMKTNPSQNIPPPPPPNVSMSNSTIK